MVASLRRVSHVVARETTCEFIFSLLSGTFLVDRSDQR